MTTDGSAPRRAIARVRDKLWRSDLAQLPAPQRWALLALRTIVAVLRDISRGDITLWAMSLVYTTLLAMVPLLAISFSILKGFGVHNQVEPLLLELLAPLGDKATELTARIIGFVDNIKVGVLGSLGFVLLFYTAVSLMQKIELAFNQVWRIRRGRGIGQRIRDYLSVLVLGPTLVFSALGITAAVMSSAVMSRLSDVEPIGTAIAVGGRLTPIVLLIAALTFMYGFIPNTRVRLLPAVMGGTVAAALWFLAGSLFARFVETSTNYAAIYSTFATLIFFLIWIYVIWLILLVGNSIAYYVQYPARAVDADSTRRIRPRDEEILALAVAALIARRFYDGGEPWTEDALAQRLQQDVHAVQDVVLALERGGLIRPSGDTPPGLLPALPFEEVNAVAVVEAVRGDGAPVSLPPKAALEDLPRLVDRADLAAAEVLGSMTLKELGLRQAADVGDVTPLEPHQPPARAGERQN